MMILVYQVLWQIIPYFLKKYLIKRSRLSSEYLNHWDERFGKPFLSPVTNCIWIHAVSVGENRAAESVISLLRKQYPDVSFLITQMTPTGRDIAKKIYPFAQCRYLPYDKKSYVQQFLKDHKPIMALFMETEIWPNFLFELRKQNIHTFLVNARMSEKSYSGYRKIKRLSEQVMQCFDKIFVQTQKDLHYFQQLGATAIEVMGSIKYDIDIKTEHKQLAEQFQNKIEDSNRPIIVCGSTRVEDGINEAYLLLDEWKKHYSTALLVIVPRHPEVFESVYNYSVELGFNTVRRSDCPSIKSDVQVVIGDSMQELMSYYLCANIAFVGGSLVNKGCHNILEPIACEIPTIFGYSTYNFEQVCEDAVNAGCAVKISDAVQWYQKIVELLENDFFYQNMQINTKQFINQHQGASVKTVSKIVSVFDTEEEA
ncbi:MAG: glycosyltransferase [Neisseriaceae bacterium]|nr:MAG: glycosyltransferase [Neisseriaceae bacterium]